MYKDYYLILECHINSTQYDIKKKYRHLAKKWHPDVNKGKDTTSKMQDIIEAYLILNDLEARKRYDIIYKKIFLSSNIVVFESHHSNNEYKKYAEKKPNKNNDNINDPILDDWIIKAKNQAKEIIYQAIKDVKNTTVSGIKYTGYAIILTIVIFLVLILLISLFTLIQS
jgi:curved DNA-binding protein CbpA